ncbi:hypothetical protein SMD22_01455 (plasmid) [Brevibacillus halotolerans]|nr:hypothetical protein SMD22_01455 [Brevibacillus halotolerans]
MENKNEVELKRILEKYEYDKSIRKQAERHLDFHQRSSIHRSINTNEDVLLEKSGIENRLTSYKEIYPLVPQDIKDLELALARYEIAVGKVIQCNRIFTFSAKEVKELIDNIYEYEEGIAQFRMRHVCQD